MGIDVDGPQTTRASTRWCRAQGTSIRNDYVIRWNSFSNDPAKKRSGS